MPAERKDVLEMPSPPKKKSSILTWILVIAICVAAGAVWLLRDVIVNKNVPERPQANQTGTVAAMQSIAPNATLPPGISGLLADGTPAPAMADAGGNATQAVSAPQGAQPAGPQDDATVRFAFVQDVAQWLVANYYPKGAHPEASKRGYLTAGVKGANLRYGVSMTGLSWTGDDLAAGRGAVLQYAFTPAMLDALYRLYADRFMAEMATAAVEPRDGKVLTPPQVKEMYQLYGARFRGLSGALQGVAGMTDLPRRVDTWLDSVQATHDANARFMENLHAYETARDGASPQQVEQARKIMELSGKTYQQTIVARERTRETMAEALRRHPDARTMDDDTLIYLAMWVNRRVAQHPERMDAVRQAATILQDIASRFDKAAAAMQ